MANPEGQTDAETGVDTSRRAVFTDIAVLAGAAGVLAVSLALPRWAAAQTKMTQKAAGYLDRPMGKAQCDNCAQWQAPGSCKVVEGAISPTGWCRIYAPKPKA